MGTIWVTKINSQANVLEALIQNIRLASKLWQENGGCTLSETRRELSKWAIVFMFGASSCASLSIESRSIDSQTYLKSRLGESIQRIQERDHFALRYCPDNTCDEIAFDHMTPEPVAWDVLLAFLTLKSSYYVLRDFKTEAVSKAIPNLTNRYQVTEAPKADFSGADIYDTLKQSYKFTVYFVRFDENHVSRIISPEN